MGFDSDGDGPAETPNRRWLGILAGVVLALIIGFIANEARLNARIERADDQVVTWKNRLAADEDEQHLWKKWKYPSGLLDEKDPWDNFLRVRYEDGKYAEKLTVSSDGPDGREFSPDDLTASASNMDWLKAAKDSAGAVEEVAGAASRGVVGGAIDGVTDRIRKYRRDKMGIPGKDDRKKEGEKK